MPSFDVVSEVDQHELRNALDQANREIGTRYDFKGSNARIEQATNLLTLEAESEFQIKQMTPILKEKMSKRGIDVDCLDFGDVVAHIMVPSVREFYALEKLWDIAPRRETGDAR